MHSHGEMAIVFLLLRKGSIYQANRTILNVCAPKRSEVWILQVINFPVLYNKLPQNSIIENSNKHVLSSVSQKFRISLAGGSNLESFIRLNQDVG